MYLPQCWTAIAYVVSHVTSQMSAERSCQVASTAVPRQINCFTLDSQLTLQWTIRKYITWTTRYIHLDTMCMFSNPLNKPTTEIVAHNPHQHQADINLFRRSQNVSLTLVCNYQQRYVIVSRLVRLPNREG